MVEIFARFAFLIYAAGIIAALVVIIAIWRRMKAQVRMAESTERIEKIIRLDQAGP